MIMRSSQKVRSVLFMALCSILFITAFAWSGSPNTFPSGQCTWYADGRAYETGWRLKFSVNSGRDARLWPNVLLNGACAVGPQAGTIMVLDGWSANPYGHVAYIESVQAGGKWTVTHANWGTGTVDRYISGYPIRKTQFEFVPGSSTKVRVVGGSTSYPLREFIIRPY